MTSPQGAVPKRREIFQRTASLWFLFAIVPFVIGFLWLGIVGRTTTLWFHRQRYVPAELEVQAVSYDAGRGSGSKAEMEGVSASAWRWPASM